MSNVIKHPKTPVDYTSGAAAKPKLLDEVCPYLTLELPYCHQRHVRRLGRVFVLFHKRKEPDNKVVINQRPDPLGYDPLG